MKGQNIDRQKTPLQSKKVVHVPARMKGERSAQGPLLYHWQEMTEVLTRGSGQGGEKHMDSKDLSNEDWRVYN